mmetsp:Transcript_56113/g.122710  ORF Transcript_56113/g.122710 Transcript_56113/m.122710 type:complete len:224 (-) Transcript_56113:1493-2164(-)
MNLCMSVRLAVGTSLHQIMDEHCNHRALFLLCVEVLDQSFTHEGSPLPIAILDLLHVVTIDEHLLLLVVYDVQWTRTSTAVRRNANLVVLQVLLNGDLRIDILSAPEALQSIPQLSRVPVHSHPDAIQEDLGVGLHVFRSAFHQVQDTPFVEEVLYDSLGSSQRDPAHERDVLHQSHCLPFGRFCRTHQAPVGIVKLPGLHQLSRTGQRCDHAPQMRQSGHEG